MKRETIIETALSGIDLLHNSTLNKGSAFTETERDVFDLHGLLPPHIGTLEEQMTRRLKALRAVDKGFERYAFLRELQDTNETLFYALLVQNLEEILPIVYTPTVGEGCQRFSEIWRKPRGLFLSYPNRDRIREILSYPRFDNVRVIVVSDGERILGLGDQGAGGMGIPIGKLSLYTACAGIHPEQTLPILLDVGTNNPERLADPLYLGWRHERITGEEYDTFIETFVSAVADRWPDVLLQWEDFAKGNAGRLLARYRDRLCTFNDDIQGTAAVATGAVLSALNVTAQKLTDQRIVMYGAGSAGVGVASLLLQAMLDTGMREAEARKHFYALNSKGLMLEDSTHITSGQAHFAQKHDAVSNWKLQNPNCIDLLDVVANAKPTILIGVSAQPGAFSEAVVRKMAEHVERPIIFPLSNPTSKAEATPQQIMEWTKGRAIVSTGSPFPPIERNGKLVTVDQTNNSYIFPGMGLGILASGARRVTDTMFMAAAKALARLSPTILDKSARLLPSVNELRSVSVTIATAVARQAQFDGVAEPCDDAVLHERIRPFIWEPRYYPYRKARAMQQWSFSSEARSSLVVSS
ncbi:MAG: NAD-dependent malic enzyme [Limisphaerales bacterium]